MVGYNGEGTIPRAGLKESLWLYIERVYGHRSLARFLGQGLILTLFSSFPTVTGCWLRAYLYRLLLGAIGKGCFLEKNIRFFNPGKLLLGERVFVGERAFFDIGPEAECIEIGDDTHISRDVIMRTQKGKIRIGKKVNIGANSFIYGYGDVEIGDHCLIANQVEINSGTHNYHDTEKPIRFQGRTANKVILKEDIWVGTHAIVLGGVTIGKGAIVGAGSVVTKDVPDFGIALGIPARVVRYRGDSEK